MGYDSEGGESAQWGDLVRVLVIEHPGDRPTAITIQVSDSDAASRSRIDSTLSGVRVP